MTTLTTAQRRDYDENGFVVIPDVFPREELQEMDKEISRLDQEIKDKITEGWIHQLGNRSEKTRQFAQDERILHLIEDIVKPGIAIYSAKLTAKLPHSNDLCRWHQDDAYYNRYSKSETRMSVWVPLQDASEQNGCLWVVPGSHKRGLQAHTTKKGESCPLSFNEEDHDYSDAIPVPVKAGSIVLFSALTWHSSKGNRTDQIRRAFIISYQEATVEGGAEEQWKVLRRADHKKSLG